MKAHVEVVCYKYKPLKDGTLPLMLRIAKSRKRRYVSLGISIDEKHWDFEKNRPKRNCPNKEMIERLISDKINEYNSLILEFTTEQRDYTAESLVNALTNKNGSKTVADLFEQIIADLRKVGKVGNAEVYKYAYDSLKNYTNNRLQIPFSDITHVWLNRFEEYLRKRGCKDTTMSQIFRTFRSVYNKALELELVKKEHYPFDKFKISRFNTKTAKRAISKDDIRKIMDVDLPDTDFYGQLAKDIFVFSYLGAGINLSDIAYLKHSNIVGDRVCYTRKKTNKQVSFKLSDELSAIINKYSSPFYDDSDYIFPILDGKRHRTPQQQYDRIHKVMRNVNKQLKEIGKSIGVSIPLTTYVARHTYATVLKRSGVNIAIISESLGHSDLATTQIYLDSFENSQIDEAMKNLL